MSRVRVVCLQGRRGCSRHALDRRQRPRLLAPRRLRNSRPRGTLALAPSPTPAPATARNARVNLFLATGFFVSVRKA